MDSQKTSSFSAFKNITPASVVVFALAQNCFEKFHSNNKSTFTGLFLCADSSNFIPMFNTVMVFWKRILKPYTIPYFSWHDKSHMKSQSPQQIYKLNKFQYKNMQKPFTVNLNVWTDERQRRGETCTNCEIVNGLQIRPGGGRDLLTCLKPKY